MRVRGSVFGAERPERSGCKVGPRGSGGFLPRRMLALLSVVRRASSCMSMRFLVLLAEVSVG